MTTARDVANLKPLAETLDINTRRHTVAAYMKSYLPNISAEAVNNAEFMKDVSVAVLASDKRPGGYRVVLIEFQGLPAGIGLGDFKDSEYFAMLSEDNTRTLCQRALHFTSPSLASRDRMKEISPFQNIEDFLNTLPDANVNIQSGEIKVLPKRQILGVQMDGFTVFEVNRVKNAGWELSLNNGDRVNYNDYNALKVDANNIVWSLLNPNSTKVKTSLIVYDHRNNSRAALSVKKHRLELKIYDGLELTDREYLVEDANRTAAHRLESFITRGLAITATDMSEMQALPITLTQGARADVLISLLEEWNAELAQSMQYDFRGDELLERVDVSVLRKQEERTKRSGEHAKMLLRVNIDGETVGFLSGSTIFYPQEDQLACENWQIKVVNRTAASQLSSAVNEIVGSRSVDEDEADLTNLYYFK